MPVKLGIIGAGTVAQLHAEAIRGAGGEIAAVCDVELDRARELAAGCGQAVALPRVDELLALDDLDAVVVAVPNFLHRDVAIAAIQAGKDLLLEKPMAMSVAECDQIMAALEPTDRVLQLGFVSRGSPTALAARRLIDEGRLGRIHHVKASVYRQRGIPGLGRWFTTRAQAGGGALIDIGVHLIDLAMHLIAERRATRVSGACASVMASPPERYVYTEMWGGPPNLQGVFDVEDSAVGLVRFEGGVTLELNVTWAAHVPPGVFPDGIALFGDRGGLFLNVWGSDLALTDEQGGHVMDHRLEISVDNPWGAAWRRQARVFADCLVSRRPSATAQHGRAVQVVVEALYRSSHEDREVEVG